MAPLVNVAQQGGNVGPHNANEVGGIAGPVPKPCACGSLTHARTSNKLCPLYRKRLRLQDAPLGVQETTVTTTIGLNSILTEELLRPVIQDAAYRCTDMFSEASRVFNGYLIWRMEAELDVPVMSLSFIRQFFLVVKARRGHALEHTATLDASINEYVDDIYANVRPAGLAWTDGRGLGQLTTNMARAYLVNCQNHLATNFESKFGVWVQWKVRRHVGLLLDLDPVLLGQVSQFVMASRAIQDLANFPPAVREFAVDANREQPICNCVNLVIGKALRLLTRADGILSMDSNIIKTSWQKYIRPFWRILKTFENHSEEDALDRILTRRRGRGLRVFSLAPIASNKAHYMSIDTDALHDLLRCVNGLVVPVPTRKSDFRDEASLWWSRMFNLNKVTTYTRRFSFSLETDGVGVSVHLLKPKGNALVNEYGFTYTQPSVNVPLIIGPARVVALDPGRRDLYAGVSRQNTTADDGIYEAGDEDEQVIGCSNVRWQEISGTRYASKKGALWLAANGEIATLVRDMPTPRCSSTAAYSNHLALFLANRDELLGFYREMKWRRLRWKTRIKRQKAYDTLCGEIGNHEVEAVIIYGNGAFSSTSRGHPSAPKKGLFTELRRRYKNTRLGSEYRTSQICSKCEGELDGMRIWGLKKCNNTCLTLWNRDVNAARNIRHMFLYRNAYNEYPEPFRRG